MVAACFAVGTSGHAAAADQTRPVWLVSNGFHTSLALRTRDVPFAAELAHSRGSQALLFGWGAGDFYRGKTNAWTLFTAVIGASPSLLHVVPVHDRVARRFAHSDVLEFEFSPWQLRSLVAQIDAAFARDRSGRRRLLGRGYFPDSSFYFGRERFFFPKMCNTWVAEKLHRSGEPFCVPGAIMAPWLVDQASHLGRREQRRSKPVDAF